MKIENFLSLISKEAELQINELCNSANGLPWKESGQIAKIRADLREVIILLTNYANDLPKDEVISWLYSNGLSRKNQLICDIQ